MKIEIAKNDIWVIRNILRQYINSSKSCASDTREAGKKLTKRLGKALVGIYGHDCNGRDYVEAWNASCEPKTNGECG